MIRGISGGQKKRVTGGEMLVGPAKVRGLSQPFVLFLCKCRVECFGCCSGCVAPAASSTPHNPAVWSKPPANLRPAPPRQVLFADEISTGLDSATTHDIVQVGAQTL